MGDRRREAEKRDLQPSSTQSGYGRNPVARQRLGVRAASAAAFTRFAAIQGHEPASPFARPARAELRTSLGHTDLHGLRISRDQSGS